jgi:hypothetical protein
VTTSQVRLRILNASTARIYHLAFADDREFALIATSTTSSRRRGVIIAMVPVGALLGFLGGLLIEIIVGLIARAVFSADHPAAFSWHFLGSLPGLGALIGAIVAPILYARGQRQSSVSRM